ncbi:amino acid ABC transporter permease [Marinomonas sp.]|nr:amino acid ABC transporter permease [Marinomonas sp.]MDB4838159.1 amino acid ABC transporter permease [Marinomonas sp.]
MVFLDVLNIAKGAGITMMFSLLGIMIGVPLGLALALIRWGKIPLLSQLTACYVSIIRSAPLVTFILFVFYAPALIDVEISPIVASILALSLNIAAFNSEIWRTALMSTPKSQIETAQAMGMTKRLVFFKVIYPQVWRRSISGLVNDMTILIKLTPAVAVIGVVEITRMASRVGASTYDPLPPFLVATLIYVVILLFLVRGQRVLERKIASKYGLKA